MERSGTCEAPELKLRIYAAEVRRGVERSGTPRALELMLRTKLGRGAEGVWGDSVPPVVPCEAGSEP